jgi:tetratricopeptide (TPR) repeat protein
LADLELKDYNGAYHAWLRAAELNPNDEKVLYYLGRLFYDADLPNEAAAWLRKALTLAPSDYAAMTYLGLSAEALGYDDTALGLYRNAVFESNVQHKPYSWAYLSLGKLLAKRGDPEQALRVLQEGRRKCPEAHLLTTLGDLLASHNQPEEAEAVLRQAVALDPSVSQAHYRLALLLKAHGKSEDARLEMEKFQAAKNEENKSARVIALRR